MHRNHYLLFEKIAVYAVTAVMLGVIYFGLAPAALPKADPTGPICPVATASVGGEVLILVTLVAICGLMGFIGGPVRSSGVGFMVLGSMAGFAMASGKLRVLLWDTFSPGRIFVALVVELGIFLVIGVLCETLAAIMWEYSHKKLPKFKWTDITDSLDTKQLAELAKENIALPRRMSAWQEPLVPAWLGGSFICTMIALVIKRKEISSSNQAIFKKNLSNIASFCGIAICIAVICSYVILQSTNRGQAVFATFASFYLAVRIAQHFYPVTDSFSVWLLPLLAGGVFYVVAMATVSTGPQAWVTVRPQLQALPIDWMFAGGAGAMFGLWSADRATESKIIEKLELVPDDE